MEKEVMQLNFSNDTTANVLIDAGATLAAAAVYKEYGKHGIIEEVTCDNYNEQNLKFKKSLLGFAAKQAGINKVPTDATEMAFAMDNTVFRSIMNSINAQVIGTMMVKYRSPQLDNLTSVDNVKVGDSKTYEIDTKALPIAQKATYGSNVSMVPSYAMGSITVTPKPYTVGVSLDFIRIVANDYDWGRALARVYAGLVFAQYKLVVSQIFNPTILTGTPFYQENFSSAAYTQMASDIGMLNGGSADNVLALGTRVAWNAISALATQGGFTTRDEYVRNGYLQKIYSVDSMVLDQFTNFSAPFTNANAAALRAIPDNLIVLVPTGADKICKLVREDYIRVIETAANDNTLNRLEYTYFQNFDAKLATASYFGLQGTTAA